jgi:MFS superfamily sulfate permease-like transporter
MNASLRRSNKHWLFDYQREWLRWDLIAGLMKALADKMEPKPKVMALDVSGVPDLDYTALKMLIEAEKRERQRGVSVWLVGLNPDVLSVIQRSSLGEILGRERMHFNLQWLLRNIWPCLWARAQRDFGWRDDLARPGHPLLSALFSNNVR